MVNTEIYKEVKVMGNLQVVKKAGAYDEKRGWVIPLSYDEITKLKTGVFIARQYRSDEPPFGETYQLYSEKGRLDYHYEGCITEVLYDKNEEIFAIKVTDLSNHEWHLVEIDYQNNAINKLYQNSIVSVDLLSNNCIRLLTLEGEIELFSRELKQVIHKLAEKASIHLGGKQGFIISNRDELKGFINLEGKLVLDYKWNAMVLGDDFITVVKELGNGEYNFGLYTYEGKEVLPCTYWGMEYVPGITPELCRIDGEKIWLFNIHRKENGIYYDELIKADGEAVLSISGDDVFMSDVSIWVYEGSNVIIKEKNKATLYKLEMNNHCKIKAVIVCEADKIAKLRDYGLYRVYKGRKRGICNKNGTMIEPLRFMVRKE